MNEKECSKIIFTLNVNKIINMSSFCQKRDFILDDTLFEHDDILFVLILFKDLVRAGVDV
jgi:hypothetical protein